MSYLRNHLNKIAFLGVVVVTILFVGWLAGEENRSPISLDTTKIASPICAGELISFHVMARFEEDAIFSIWRALVDLTTHKTILTGAGSPPFSIRRKGETLNTELSYPTPSDLAPGPYEYRVAVEKSGAEALIFFVPFEIQECNADSSR